MSGFWPSIVTIFTAIVGLAVVAVVLSNRSTTVALSNSTWGGFGNAISAATNPYSGTGNSSSANAGLMNFGDLSSALSQFNTQHF